MATTIAQPLLWDGTPIAVPCDGERNVQSRQSVLAMGQVSTLRISFLGRSTFTRVLPDGTEDAATWRFELRDKPGAGYSVLFATNSVTVDPVTKEIAVDCSGTYTVELAGALGERPVASFPALLSGYNTDGKRAVSVAFPLSVANTTDEEAMPEEAESQLNIVLRLVKRVDAIEELIPANASAQNKLATLADVSAAGGKFIVVQTLPSAASADPKAIYLVPRQPGETGNIYDEYVRVESAPGTYVWEKIGSTEIDLSEYRKAAAQDAIDGAQDTAIAAKQDTISDLDEIRYGAAAGATAVQPSMLPPALPNPQPLHVGPVNYDGSTEEYVPGADTDGHYGIVTLVSETNSTKVTGHAATPLAVKTVADSVAAKATATALAPAFSASSTYAVGDYCTYKGALYKCTTAVSTEGAWNAANWTAVAVVDEMAPNHKVYAATATASQASGATVYAATTFGGDFSRDDGCVVVFTAPSAASGSSPQLNVNGTGARPIVYRATSGYAGVPASEIRTGKVCFCQFRTGNDITGKNLWVLLGWEKAPLNSPEFTGTPTAPTAASGTNTKQVATTAFVQQEIAATVGNINSVLDAINGEVV